MDISKVCIIALSATVAVATTRRTSVLKNSLQNDLCTGRRLAGLAQQEVNLVGWDLNRKLQFELKQERERREAIEAQQKREQQMREAKIEKHNRLVTEKRNRREAKKEIIKRQQQEKEQLRMERMRRVKMQQLEEERLRKERIEKTQAEVQRLANNHYRHMEEQRKWIRENYDLRAQSEVFTSKQWIAPVDDGEPETEQEAVKMMMHVAAATHNPNMQSETSNTLLNTPPPPPPAKSSTAAISLDDLLSAWIKENPDVKPTKEPFALFATSKGVTNINASNAKLFKKWSPKHEKWKAEQIQAKISQIETAIKKLLSGKLDETQASEKAEIVNDQTLEQIMIGFKQATKRTPNLEELVRITNGLNLPLAKDLKKRFRRADTFLKKYKSQHPKRRRLIELSRLMYSLDGYDN